MSSSHTKGSKHGSSGSGKNKAVTQNAAAEGAAAPGADIAGIGLIPLDHWNRMGPHAPIRLSAAAVRLASLQGGVDVSTTLLSVGHQEVSAVSLLQQAGSTTLSQSAALTAAIHARRLRRRLMAALVTPPAADAFAASAGPAKCTAPPAPSSAGGVATQQRCTAGGGDATGSGVGVALDDGRTMASLVLRLLCEGEASVGLCRTQWLAEGTVQRQRRHGVVPVLVGCFAPLAAADVSGELAIASTRALLRTRDSTLIPPHRHILRLLAAFCPSRRCRPAVR